MDVTGPHFEAEATRQLTLLRARLETERSPAERSACEQLIEAWQGLLRHARRTERDDACDVCGHWFLRGACCRND